MVGLQTKARFVEYSEPFPPYAAITKGKVPIASLCAAARIKRHEGPGVAVSPYPVAPQEWRHCPAQCFAEGYNTSDAGSGQHILALEW